MSGPAQQEPSAVVSGVVSDVDPGADSGVGEAAAAVAAAVARHEAPAMARVGGEPILQLPLDLYIPPDALEVFLDAFEGPLDLLLYLIKRQNLDILNIPIAEVTAQYMRYIAVMETLRLELASEYLLMAAMLAEIKSRMLLPRIDDADDDEDDPRAELIRRLREYERIKEGAEGLEALPRIERELFPLKVVAPVIEREQPEPDVKLAELLLAFTDVAERARLQGRHEVAREGLSVRARMSRVLSVLSVDGFCEFTSLFDPSEGRAGMVVTFLAILELCKEASIDIVQVEAFSPIYLTPRGEPLPDSVQASRPLSRRAETSPEPVPDAPSENVPETRSEAPSDTTD